MFIRQLVFLVLIFLSPIQSIAAVKEYAIRIKAHKFVPSTLEIPSNTKVKLLIINEDVTPEEFESYELNREKIVPGKGKITVFVGPLKAGRYPFFGEFNPKTAQGVLIAK